jgi:hypothetical protein
MPTHPSITALLRAEGSTDAEASIRKRARLLVADALNRGWTGPPFDVVALASRCQLTVSHSFDLLADQDACVIPGQIILNARKPKARQRYSVGHEIVHTLFPDYQQAVALAKLLWRDSDHSEFERLCQVGAAEIIFPAAGFTAALHDCGVSLNTVLTLAKKYDASPEATLRRALELSHVPVLGLAFRPCLSDSNPVQFLQMHPGDPHRPRTQLGASLVCLSSVCPPVVCPIGSSPPNGSAPDQAWKRAALNKGTVTIRRAVGNWPLLDPRNTWISEAVTLPLGSGHPQQVFALVFPG